MGINVYRKKSKFCDEFSTLAKKEKMQLVVWKINSRKNEKSGGEMKLVNIY